MKQADDLEDLLEELAEKQEPFMALIPNFLSNIKAIDKPISVFSTFSFLPRIESIRAGIFEMAKIDDIYSAKILYRSLIEHWVKFQFLLLKTLEAKDDAVGIDYWFFGQGQENLDFLKSLKSIRSFLNINDDKLPIDELKDLGAIPKELSGTKIQSRLDQFKYKNMTNYLIENYSKSSKKSEMNCFLEVFPRFSLLSSYVHGGPDSIKSEGPLNDNFNVIINTATIASLSTRQFSFLLLYQYDKGFGELVNIAREYTELHQQYNNASQATPKSGDPD